MKTPLIILFLLLLLATACSNEQPQPTPVEALEIMTLLSNTEDEGCRLQFQRTRGSEVIEVESAQWFKGEIESGRRLLVYYQAEYSDTALRPMPVTLLQVGAIPFDTVRARTRQEIEELGSPQMEVVSAWLTDNHVNLQTLLNYSGEPRSFTLVAEQTSLLKDTLELYLAPRGAMPDQQYVERRAYGSFFLETWKWDAIRLHCDKEAFLLH